MLQQDETELRKRQAEVEVLASFSAALKQPFTPEEVIARARGGTHEPLKIEKQDAPIISLKKTRELRDVQRKIREVGDAILAKHFGSRKVLSTEIMPGIGGRLEKAAAMRDETGYLPADPPRPTDKGGTPIAPARPQPPPFAGQGLWHDEEFLTAMREAIANGRTIRAGESVLLRGRQVPMNPALEDEGSK